MRFSYYNLDKDEFNRKYSYQKKKKLFTIQLTELKINIKTTK